MKIQLSIILSLIILAGCSQKIDKVKSGKIMYMGQYLPIQQIVDGLAQADGGVKWSEFQSVKNNAKKTVVQADIGRNGKTARLQFLYNADRDIHELAYFELHGKPESIIVLSVAMMFGI